MKSTVANAGYVLDNATNVWSKPGYGGIAYNDGDAIENRIASIISEAEDISVLSSELRRQCTDWPSLYHLASSRSNIMRPFESALRGASVLEIGAGCGAITRYLGESGAQVLALEGTLRRASIARSRTRDLPNIEVVADRFSDFDCDQRFDIVTLIGVLEYANMFAPGDSPALTMLQRVRGMLKPGGQVIIAIENQLGLKYFAGAPEDHLGSPMYGIEARYRSGQPQTYGRAALESLLKEAGFASTELMAPFPDYKMPASILTKAGIEAQDFDAGAFAWQAVKRDPQLPGLMNFSMELAWPVIGENKLVLDLANSFLAVGSLQQVQSPGNALAFHYSTDRIPAYCKETQFHRRSSGTISVSCRRLGDIRQEPENSAVRFSPPNEIDYTIGTPLSWEFIQIVTRDGWSIDELANFFRRYLEILGSFIDDGREILTNGRINSDAVISGRYFDALPQNIICKRNGGFQLIDTEWSTVGSHAPAQLIFRSILWLIGGITRFGQSRDAMPMTRLALVTNIFNALGISASLNELHRYFEVEAAFQLQVTGRDATDFVRQWPEAVLQTLSVPQAIAERENQIPVLAELRAMLSERDRQVETMARNVETMKQQVSDLTEQASRLTHEVQALRASTSWKVTSPMRWGSLQLKRANRIAKLAPSAFRLGGGVRPTMIKAVRLYRNYGVSGVKRGLLHVQTNGQVRPAAGSEDFDRNDYSEWVKRYDTLDEQGRQHITGAIEAFPHKPLISLVMPVYDPPLQYLDAAIRSVRNQLYPAWELCIADDASKNPEVRKLLAQHAQEDERIKVVYRETNGHISAATNSALAAASGEFVALMDNDDLLTEHALYWVAQTIVLNPEAELIYSDEDKINEKGVRYAPYFKCEFNLELMLAHNMICHLGAYRRSRLLEIGGFRLGFEGAQDYDVALRFIATIQPEQIKHIPRVLYHWRAIAGSTALAGDEKNYAAEAGRRAVSEFLAQRLMDAQVLPAPEAPGMNRVRFAVPEPAPLVSIIIPTRDRVDLLRMCIESVMERSTYPAYEIIVVDNGSVEPETAAFFQALPKNKVTIVRDDSPFNFSALNNRGARVAKGEVLCLMNNDIEILTPGWLEEMVSFAARADIGAVGARLWYKEGLLQHGGVILGIGGVAGHSHKYLPKGSAGYFGRTVLHQELSAVTAACLVIRREVFEAVGGLDEDLAVAFNDVDFCMRIRKAGYRNVWTPYSEMIHHESVSRGHENTPEKQARFAGEVRKMQDRWGDGLFNDQAYSVNLTLEHEDFSLAWPPRF